LVNGLGVQTALSMCNRRAGFEGSTRDPSPRSGSGAASWNRNAAATVHQWMTVAYRNLDAVVEERIDRFRARRAEERDGDAALKRLFAARAARIAAGGAGTVAGLALFAVAAGSFSFLDNERGANNTYALFGSWAALGVSGLVAWPLARRHARDALRREPIVSGDTHADVMRIETADPLGELRARVTKLEFRSTALPLAAASLLVPLTLHWAVAALASWSQGSTFKASDFGVWISASAALVGLAHCALVAQLALWARSLRDRPTSRLRERIHGTWARILAVTTGVGLIPAIFFAWSGEAIVLLPAALVAVTGITFIPFLVVGTARCVERERAALEVPRP
jgi:hypothetical protein